MTYSLAIIAFGQPPKTPNGAIRPMEQGTWDEKKEEDEEEEEEGDVHHFQRPPTGIGSLTGRKNWPRAGKVA